MNNDIDFIAWKHIFLGYKCLQPKDCLDKNHFTYNCFYCNRDSYWKQETLNVDDDDIQLVPYFGEPGLPETDRRERRGWSSVAFKQHPLVHRGDAYWIYDNTLLTGYTLLNDKTIWRPIFSFKREKMLNMVRCAIKKYVGTNGFIRKIRQNIVKKNLLGIKYLSYDLIKLISEWI